MSHSANKYVKHLKKSPKGDILIPSEKLVLSLLADDHNEDERCAWPSIGFLAERACIGERYCRSMLRKLETMGVLESMPRLRDNGSHTSRAYRFCEIDPPFDRKKVVETEKRLQLQAAQRASRPVQAMLYPPENAGGGGGGLGSPTLGASRTPGWGPGEPQGGELEDRRVGLPSSPPEPLLESLGEPRLSPPLEPQDTPPTPPTGGCDLASMDTAWSGLKIRLKSELCSAPANKNFPPIREGENDYDACFRDWWLVDIQEARGHFLITTEAHDVPVTSAGVAKYSARLERLAREAFGLSHTVLFVVRGYPKEEPSLNELVLGVTFDAWQLVKQELEHQIGQLPKRDADGLLNYFLQGIAPATLLRIEMDADAPVWTLHAPNPKKTMAILSLLRRLVTPAMRKIAKAEVRIVVVDAADP